MNLKGLFKTFAVVLAVLALLSTFPKISYANQGEVLWEKSLDDLESSGLTYPIDEIFHGLYAENELSFKGLIHQILTGRIRIKDCLVF